MILIKNGYIYDAINPNPYKADILIKDGKIADISPELSCETAEIVDVNGLSVYPGFIDAHSHIGLDGYGIGFEGMDYNEVGDVVTPQLRGIDGVKAMDPAFKDAIKAGVTCVCTGPGSANVLGGTFTAIKTVGKRVDSMIIAESVAMKCAFGENPKVCYRDKGNCTRMTTAYQLRNMLFKAKEYAAKIETAGDDISKRPPFDMKLEALLPVIRKEMPLKAHTHATDDIFAAIRIAKEFDVKLTLEHVTEGHLIVEELVQENYPMAVGPGLIGASKFELRNKSWTTPGVLAKAGGQVSIVTDAPVVPQEYLPLCAGLAVKAGMDRFAALQAITINAAKHIGVSDRVGSIEIGKDADIVVTDGDPMNLTTAVKYVFVDGQCVVKQ